MTNAERIQAICEMGYRPKEAEFLCLAALHSGYFLRRQFLRFLGVHSGGSERRLIQRLTARRHAREHRIGSGTRLVHLCSHPFYRAIGQPENRHRRRRALPAIQVKVMGLDFVLSHQGRRFLPTEEDKLEHFHGRLGIALGEIPCKVYPSPSGGPSATRYFVDKLPVFCSPSGTSFVYIDAASVSCSGFDTYLRQYFALLNALPKVSVIFASCEPHKIRWARRRFQAILGASPLRASALIRFFQLERLYRERDFDRLPQAKLIELREARRRFREPCIEGLFAFWLKEGDEALQSRLRSKHSWNGQFVPYAFEENYDCFRQQW